MKTLLKVLGWIIVCIAVVGGSRVIAREGIHTYTFAAEAVYLALAWLCFWGSKRLKKKDEEK
jgi:TRAP-type C4-dicarboxylate transport system permease small subunit